MPVYCQSPCFILTQFLPCYRPHRALNLHLFRRKRFLQLLLHGLLHPCLPCDFHNETFAHLKKPKCLAYWPSHHQRVSGPSIPRKLKGLHAETLLHELLDEVGHPLTLTVMGMTGDHRYFDVLEELQVPSRQHYALSSFVRINSIFEDVTAIDYSTRFIMYLPRQDVEVSTKAFQEHQAMPTGEFRSRNGSQHLQSTYRQVANTSRNSFL